MLSAPNADFVTAIRTALQSTGLLNAQVVVVDPDARTTLIGPRDAFVTSTAPTDMVEAGLLSGKMRTTISFIPDPADPPIVRGYAVRVLPGGDVSPLLSQLVFEVLGSPVDSVNVLTQLECSTNGMLAAVWSDS